MENIYLKKYILKIIFKFMSGVSRLISGEVAQSKVKGAALVSALGEMATADGSEEVGEANIAD